MAAPHHTMHMLWIGLSVVCGNTLVVRRPQRSVVRHFRTEQNQFVLSSSGTDSTRGMWS